MKVRITEVDVPNKNGHIYSTECVQSFLGKEVLGQIGMVAGEIDLSNVSHKISNLRIEDGFVVGDVTTLNTPQGRLLSDLLESTNMCFRMSGYGNIDENGNISEFELISVNLVNDGA